MIKNLLLAGCVCLGTFANAQQIANGNLESWTDSGLGYEDPDGFVTLNILSLLGAPVSVEKTTSSHQGTYAAEITATTADLGNGPETLPGILAVGSGQNAGIAYTARPDSLVFWYKYAPQGGDEGSAIIELTLNGNEVGSGTMVFANAQATYARGAVEIVYANNNTPDTLNLAFVTGTATPQAGTMLTIDAIGLVFNGSAGLDEVAETKQIDAFPNPANAGIEVAISNGQMISIYSSNGKLIETVPAASNGNNTKISTAEYVEGFYILRSEDGSTARFAVKH